VAYALATLLNYLLNYYWSFASGEAHSTATAKFLTVAVAGAVLNSAFVALVTNTAGLPFVWAGLIFALIWPIASFSAQKLWAFRA
jgi:putative flippase GtrA